MVSASASSIPFEIVCKAKSRANGDGDVFPRKNKAGQITSYRGAYFGPDGKRRYVSGKTK